MPSQVDTPTGPGASFAWGLWGSAASKMAAVATDDGDTSVIFASSGGRTVLDLYTFPQLLGVADPVTAASLSARTREYLQGGGGRAYYLYWNGVGVGTNRQQEVHLAKKQYVTVTYNGAGADLVLATVNGQHGLVFSAAGGPSNKAEYWVTHLYRSVTFNYGTGGAGEFAYLIGSLAGAFIGGGLLLREMPGLSAFMRARGRKWLLPDEYETAWRAWTAHRHMRMA